VAAVKKLLQTMIHLMFTWKKAEKTCNIIENYQKLGQLNKMLKKSQGGNIKQKIKQILIF
jgi:hypothetical protein